VRIRIYLLKERQLIVYAFVVYNVAMDVNTSKKAKNVLRTEHELF
jgi:hypothetical protein